MEILFFILVIIGHAYYDFFLIEKRKTSPTHLKETIIFIISTFTYFLIWDICTHTKYSFINLIELVMLYNFVLLPIRWIVFDLSLNYLRGKDLLYISNKKKNNSYIDTIFYNFGNKLIYVKSALLIFGFIIYYLFLNIIK